MNSILEDLVGAGSEVAKFTLKFLVSSLIYLFLNNFLILREAGRTKSEAEGGGRWTG